MSCFNLVRTGRTPEKEPVYDLRIDGVVHGRRLLMCEVMRIIREYEEKTMERGVTE